MTSIHEYSKKSGKKLPEIIGLKVSLIPIPDSEEFYKLYHKWLSNKEIKKAIGEEDIDYTYEEVVKMHDEWKKDLKNITYCILDSDKKPIGDINLFDSKEFNEKPELAIMIGENSGKGCGTEASNLLINFAFNEINLEEINLSVYKDNLPAIKIYKKLGFKITGESLDKNKEEFLMKITKQDFIK